MMYLGGKTKLAKSIAAVIEDRREGRTRFVEPFAGSAAVTAAVASSFDTVIAADLHTDLVMMWRAACAGWVPPTTITREHYDELRTAEPSALRGFAGFPCSFSGKWFGGYANDPLSDRNYAAAGSRSIVKRAANMRHVEWLNVDWSSHAIDSQIDENAVVYCDPPYAGTTGYASTGTFDHGAFWQTARRWAERGAVVLVSEFAAPDGWQSVWNVERHSSTARDNTARRAVDHVFMYV